MHVPVRADLDHRDGPEGYLVTVTSYGYTSNCRYIDGLQRVGIDVVQDCLAEFGVHPAAA